MRDHYIARTVCSEALLFRAQNYARFYLIRSEYHYTSSPQLVKGIGKGDWAVLVQPSRVPLLIEEDGVALELYSGGDSSIGQGLKEEVKGLMKCGWHVF